MALKALRAQELCHPLLLIFPLITVAAQALFLPAGFRKFVHTKKKEKFQQNWVTSPHIVEHLDDWAESTGLSVALEIDCAESLNGQ